MTCDLHQGYLSLSNRRIHIFKLSRKSTRESREGMFPAQDAFGPGSEQTAIIPAPSAFCLTSIPHLLAAAENSMGTRLVSLSITRQGRQLICSHEKLISQLTMLCHARERTVLINSSFGTGDCGDIFSVNISTGPGWFKEPTFFVRVPFSCSGDMKSSCVNFLQAGRNAGARKFPRIRNRLFLAMWACM